MATFTGTLTISVSAADAVSSITDKEAEALAALIARKINEFDFAQAGKALIHVVAVITKN